MGRIFVFGFVVAVAGFDMKSPYTAHNILRCVSSVVLPPQPPEELTQQVCTIEPSTSALLFFLMCECVQRGSRESPCPQKPAGASHTLRLKLQVVVSCPVWVLETELRSLAGAICTLIHASTL